MRIVKSLAVAGALLAGMLGLGGSASATPFASGAMPAVQADNGGLVTKAYHRGRPHYGYRPAYRPYRPVYRGYRPSPRVVCRTTWRTFRTSYGRPVTRPVRNCFRRW